MKRSSKKGFTLIELIIVIAILAILAVIIIPRVLGVKGSAQEGVNRTNAKQIQSALAQYYADWDNYPASTTQFTTFITKNLGKVPAYKNGHDMGTYAPPTGTATTYVYTFAEDPGTEFGENGIQLTEGTNTSALFKH